MRVLALALLASLAFTTLAVPVASADVVVGVYVCDVEQGYCTCRNLTVREPYVHYHKPCTFW